MEIVLPVPPSTNTAYPTNRHGRHLSKAGRDWKNNAMFRIVEAKLEQPIPVTPLTMEIIIWFPDQRVRDVDNYVKLVKDVVCEQLHISDDCTVIPRVTVEFQEFDRVSPRCVVRLTPYTSAIQEQAA